MSRTIHQPFMVDGHDVWIDAKFLPCTCPVDGDDREDCPALMEMRRLQGEPFTKGLSDADR